METTTTEVACIREAPHYPAGRGLTSAGQASICRIKLLRRVRLPASGRRALHRKSRQHWPADSNASRVAACRCLDFRETGTTNSLPQCLFLHVNGKLTPIPSRQLIIAPGIVFLFSTQRKYIALFAAILCNVTVELFLVLCRDWDSNRSHELRMVER